MNKGKKKFNPNERLKVYCQAIVMENLEYCQGNRSKTLWKADLKGMKFRSHKNKCKSKCCSLKIIELMKKLNNSKLKPGIIE